MTQTSLLVVGAGRYGLSTAAHAWACGIDTLVVGHPMGFWRDNMYASTNRQLTRWWRGLPRSARRAIAQRFWEAGQLSLERWLTPRLPGDRIHRHPRIEVMEARARDGSDEIAVRLTDGEQLVVDTPPPPRSSPKASLRRPESCPLRGPRGDTGCAIS